ncbi:MAG TPA: methyltransferase domain-containing protein [Hyphomicrobiales bacterium]|nr:methyltransferase domain-containing protein [Hyphomicrobiales bacterium]
METARPPRLFDHALIARRAAALERRGIADDFMMPRLAGDLAERLMMVLREFPAALDLGSPGPAVADTLRRLPQIGRLHRAGAAGADLLCRLDALPVAPESLNLVVSAGALHWVEDLPGVFAQVRRALAPDGLFLAALFGGDTLAELRQAFAAAEAETMGGTSPRVIPFADVRDVGALLQRAGFALPVVDSERTVVRYGDLMDLVRDLRRLGATNPLLARRRAPLRRDTLARLDAIYRERFADPDGRLRVTVEVVWLSGWAPHASQQQPLRPGSAKARLADALAATRNGRQS